MKEAAPALAVRSLRFRWPGAAHETLSIGELSIAAAEQVYLHGPSGCGKSTLLSLAAGVLDADAGIVAVNGQAWSEVPRVQRDAWRAESLGIVFQQFNLLPYLSAVDNVCLGCHFSARRRARACTKEPNVASRARALLLDMGLAPGLHELQPSRLSVGQQQRVAAARGLIGGPSVLLADEPTSALDESLRAQFMDLLQTACRAAGTALLFISHDSGLAARFDRVLALPELTAAGGA